MRLHHVQVACPAGGEGVARGTTTRATSPACSAWVSRTPSPQRDSFPGRVRCHCVDGHGNRVEILQSS